MVTVAQLAEHLAVAERVEGSIPSGHPTPALKVQTLTRSAEHAAADRKYHPHAERGKIQNPKTKIQK